MPKKGEELVDVDVDLVHATERAYLFRLGNGTQVWVPKSVCEYENGTCTVPTWWAEKEGMI